MINRLVPGLYGALVADRLKFKDQLVLALGPLFGWA